MDAVGCERATIFGPGYTAMSGILLAADYPDRVSSLVIVNGAARTLWANDYPAGADLSRRQPVHVRGTRSGRRRPGVRCPRAGRRTDGGRRRGVPNLVGSCGNRAASPSMARAVSEALLEGDVREQLSLITAPTLILHRSDARFVGVDHGRTLPSTSPEPLCRTSRRGLDLLGRRDDRCSTRSKSSSPVCVADPMPNVCSPQSFSPNRGFNPTRR